MKYLQVFTTVSNKEEAQKIADLILNKRLAGCVQIHPITSSYWWKEKIETNEEWFCIFKTREELYEELEKVIKEIHSYETPEIIATPIVNGSLDYLKWLKKETKK